MTTTTFTDEALNNLASEADEMGDVAMVELCIRAMHGDLKARAACASFAADLADALAD